MTFLCLKIGKWPQKKKWKKNVKNIFKPKILEKKLAATARQRLPHQQKRKRNSEDPSGSIRDITAHLIHDKKTSIAVSCTVFNFPSAGNDPGWIYWSYEFLIFRPRGLWTRRPAQTGPGCQNMAFQRFDPIIIHDFSRRLRKTTLEMHSSKQMTVYEQITFFIKIRNFQNLILWWKVDSWAWK